MPDPSPQPTPPPPDPEVARIIPDQQMVFVSREDATPKLPTKALKKKMQKSRLEDRKSTPAPSTKGAGRKRFVPSPLPEDKQLRKKLTFGAEEDPHSESSLRKGTLFPASHQADEEEILNATKSPPFTHYAERKADFNSGELPASDQESGDGPLTDGNCEDSTPAAPPPADNGSRESQQTMEVGVVNLPRMDKGTKSLLKSSFVPYQPSSGVTCAAKDALGGAIVSFPDLVKNTKHPMESSLVHYHEEGLSEVLAVEPSMQPTTHELIHLATSNSAETLDAMAAQPLLHVGTLEHGGSVIETRTGPAPWLEPPKPVCGRYFNASLEEFPPLEKGRTLKIRDTFEKGTSPRKEELAAANLKWGNSSHQGMQPNSPLRLGYGEPTFEAAIPMVTEDKEPEMSNNHKSSNLHGPNHQSPNLDAGPSSGPNHASQPKTHEAHPEHAEKPISMADMLKGSSDPNGPQVFEPEKIQNIGFASSSNGIPAIYFSGTETRRLAEGMGHAIVGKFSHSIPTGHQIQKALDNIKLRRGFNWKYINAKHILIQCEDLADYARIFGSPRGSPIWFIDRHPMRVFKWSPEFDAYCESPIAAIWCNLIGLPIHLYDHSALFAIGKLLGTPIQIDRATANKSRLSFARICIEIDITKPPPEEFILDICGRETVQQVRWDKIPSYCQECKHVGHTREACYATGKKERPAKKNYNVVPPKQPHTEDRGTKDKQDTGGKDANPNEWKHQGKKKNNGADRTYYKAKGTKGVETNWQGPDILGDFNDFNEGPLGPYPADGMRRGREPPSHRKGSKPFVYSSEEATLGDVTLAMADRGGKASSTSKDPNGSATKPPGTKGRKQEKASQLSTNQYYSLMEEEEFEDGDHEDNENFVMGEHTSDDAGDTSILVVEAGTEHGVHDQLMIEYRGGPSHPPGTKPNC